MLAVPEEFTSGERDDEEICLFSLVRTQSTTSCWLSTMYVADVEVPTFDVLSARVVLRVVGQIASHIVVSRNLDGSLCRLPELRKKNKYSPSSLASFTEGVIISLARGEGGTIPFLAGPRHFSSGVMEHVA